MRESMMDGMYEEVSVFPTYTPYDNFELLQLLGLPHSS